MNIQYVAPTCFCGKCTVFKEHNTPGLKQLPVIGYYLQGFTVCKRLCCWCQLCM